MLPLGSSESFRPTVRTAMCLETPGTLGLSICYPIATEKLQTPESYMEAVERHDKAAEKLEKSQRGQRRELR